MGNHFLNKKILFLSFALIFLHYNLLFADKIILKNDHEIEGKILSRTADSVTIEFAGVAMPYFADTVKEVIIDGQKPFTLKAQSAAGEASKPAQDNEALAKELIEISGTREYIKQFIEDALAAFKETTAKLPPNIYARLLSSMTENMRQEKAHKIFSDYFKKYLDRKTSLEALQWFKSPLGKKLVQLEREASTPSAREEMKSFSNILQSSPASKKRLELSQKFDKVSGSSQFTILAQATIFESNAKVFNPIAPEQNRLSEIQIKQLSQDLKQQLELPMKNQSLMGFLYAYRSVSDADLEKYIAFLSSATGKRFNATLQKATLKMIKVFTEDAGKEAVKIIEDERAKQNQ